MIKLRQGINNEMWEKAFDLGTNQEPFLFY